MFEHTAVIIMAAGAGTRFKSKRSKLLHDLAGKPAIKYISEALKEAGFAQNIFVLSHQKEEIKTAIGKDSSFYFVEQEKLDGTAGAVKVALKELKPSIRKILVIPGDTPMIPLSLLKRLLSEEELCVVATKLKDPRGFGRIKVDKSNNVMSIIEQSELSDDELSIDLVNTSIYSFSREFLESNIEGISIKKGKSEYYLTDIVSIAREKGLNIKFIEHDEPDDVIGPNDKIHFSKLARRVWLRRASSHCMNGVNIVDLDSVYIDDEVLIDSDVTIYPNVFITGKSKIHSGVTILENCRINDSEISEDSLVGPGVFMDGSKIGSENRIGPFTYIRPGTNTSARVKIGGFVETKKAEVGEGSKIPHLSYVGDAKIGKKVNVGCGVITCNYDGYNKNMTVVGDNVFIGSDSQLIAPVTIDDGSYVAAGTTITSNVPSGSLAISRTRQRNIEDYVSKLKKRKSKK